MLTLDKIYHAASVLDDVVRKTSLISAPEITTNNNVYLKAENLQVTGSFKVRGALYMISQLSKSEKVRGVVACSAGNHAQGVALAAQKYGINATICLPDSAPLSKIAATKNYFVEVLIVNGVYDDAFRRALEVRDERGAVFVHPFDDNNVIAGQGTIALEILNDMNGIDAVIAPVGGGGLISGIAYAVKKIIPKVKVYGVQALGASSMYNSLKLGSIQTLKTLSTIADGIAVKTPGENTFKLCNQYVDDIVIVTDDEISAAIFTLIKRYKIIAEGAGAAAVAAVMFDKIPMKNKNIVCVVSGGNIDADILLRAIERGSSYLRKAYDIGK